MMPLIRDKKTLKQLFLYGVTGVVLNFIGFGLYVAITWVGVEPKLTMTLLYFVGVIMSYHANKEIAFRDQETGNVVFLKFILAHVGGFLINWILLFYFFNKLGFSHELVQLGAIFIVALYLFVVFKVLVFNRTNILISSNL